MKVIVIGAGQLGSRHLQALRNTKHSLDISVSDPSLESLKVAKERYESLPEVGQHQIQYLESIPEKGSWDLAIVASNASPRQKILQHTVEKLQIKNYILEKILFTKSADYEWATRNVKNAWVNCCMRQMPVYQEIKRTLKAKDFVFNVSGSNYGLVTNAIHYLDYAAWLADSTEFSLDTSKLLPTTVPSKRKGYLELNGTLTAQFNTGMVAQITCLPNGTLPVTVEVHADSQRFVVLESERKLIHWSADTSWVRNEKDASIPYQSTLTTEAVLSFYENRPCGLTSLVESSKIHLNLLKPLKEFLIRTNQTQTEEFPFT